MYELLINKIGQDLNIRQGNLESTVAWHERILYSYVGLSMLATLYDHEDPFLRNTSSGDNISMQRVLTRALDLSEIFLFEYGKSHSEEIRQAYIKLGYMLHQANKLTFPPLKYSPVGDIFLSRGQAPWIVQNMSGLGTFAVQADSSYFSAWEDMFCVQKIPLLEWYGKLEDTIHWKEVYALPANVKFANIEEDPRAGYWLNAPPQKGITICRDIQNIEPQYYLVKISDRYELSLLPKWRTDNQEYLRIVLALRIRLGNIPFLKIQKNGEIAYIESGYLLPSFEQALYELYSWPHNNSRWLRIAAIEVLPLIEQLFKRMGFIIEVEEHSHGIS